MAKIIHKGKRKAVKAAVHKASGRSASVMKPEYLAEIERFRLMDDDFLSKCLENAPRSGAKHVRHWETNARHALPRCGGDVFRRSQETSEQIQEFRRREACHV